MSARCKIFCHSKANAGITLKKDSYSWFNWANGRAARIGRAIPVCSIECLPILEALPSFHSIFGRAGKASETKWRKQLTKTELKNGLF